MPKLPHVSGREAVRALEKLGFVQLRQKGSHLIMRRGAVGCVIPMHREIKIGTLTGALRQADVSADQFIDAL
jgi:predicted RNA binding protein YcfA (HicA-like mRNA interferase family)